MMQWIRRCLVAGLLVVVPIWGTYLVLRALFLSMEGVLGDTLKDLGGYYIPGLGIVILFCFVAAVGALTTSFLWKKAFDFWEGLLARLPLIRNVYSLVKSIVDAFSLQAGEKEKFQRVVLIEFPRKGAHTIGFVTGEVKGDTDEPVFTKRVSVFVPTVPSPISGYLLFVAEAELIPISLGVDEAMKMVVSCGLYSAPIILKEASLAGQKR